MMFRRLRILVLFLAVACALHQRAVAQAPLSGSYLAHDPSTLIKDGSRYYFFRTDQGIGINWSTDLRNWTGGGKVFPAGPPAWTTNAVPDFTGFFWAPDIAFFNGKYHLYYSISSWGTIDSAIGLVTTSSLTNPVWTDQGKVVQSDAAWEAGPTTDTTAFNCIDPSILIAQNGTVWMVYGSYSDGILVTQLDPNTGKRLNPASIGTKVASSSTSFFSNTTEAAYLHQHGGYYFLFLNYGGCCSGIDSTYNIRVGRSTSVTGPYVDKNGVNLIAGGGSVLLESTGHFVGPGHTGIFQENGTDWFTYHYYDATDNGAAKLGLGQLEWGADGWPIVRHDWSAFYTFDTNAREHRALYGGTMNRGATIATEPGRGNVLQLDGATGLISLPNAVANASTFAAWVKWNGGGDWQRVFDFGDGTTRYLFLTPRAFGGGLRFAITDAGPGGEQQINAPMALPTNSWVHVGVSLDGKRGILYLNGQSVGTNNNLTLRPWQLLARTNYVGASQWPADPKFNGWVDSLRVFGRALDAGEMKDLAWAHPALAHRYSFSTNADDSVGDAHGELKGNASIVNGALQLTGAVGGYLELPGGLLTGSTAATVEFWATFGSNGDWARAFDFGESVGASGQNFLFFSPHTSPSGTRLGLSTGTGTVNLDAAGTFDDKSLHVACVIDPPGRYLAVYTNGVLQAAHGGSIPYLSSVSAARSFIGRSLWSADAWLNASIDELRLYDGRLTPEEILTSYRSGPDSLSLAVTLAQTDASSAFLLAWPAWALGFQLESSTDAGSRNWSPVSLQTSLADDFWQVSYRKSGSARFFRLRR